MTCHFSNVNILIFISLFQVLDVCLFLLVFVCGLFGLFFICNFYDILSVTSDIIVVGNLSLFLWFGSC